MSRRFMWIYTGMCKSPFSFSTLIDKGGSSSSFSSEDAVHTVNLSAKILKLLVNSCFCAGDA